MVLQKDIGGAVDGDFWRAFGYLDGNNGSCKNVGSNGFYWSCGPGEDEKFDYYYGWHLAINFYRKVVANPRSNGYSVRPVSE